MPHPLVELARDALRRIGEAPPAAELARTALAELTAREERPLAIALRGDPSRLLAATYGDLPLERVTSLVRGPSTTARIRHADGTTRDHAPPPDRTAELSDAEAKAVAARRSLDAHSVALTRIDRAVPRIARMPPAAWALWLWPVYWIARWLARTKLAEQRTAEGAIAGARTALETSERELTSIATEEALARSRYLDLLRSAPAVQWILATGPLPEGVELVLSGDVAVDAVVDSAGLDLATLPELARRARVTAIARRTGDVLIAARAAIGSALEATEASCRARLATVEEQRIADPDAVADLQLARIDGEIVTCVSAVLEHASVHLGSEVAQLQAQWIGAIAGTSTTDELKAAVTTIGEAWDSSAQRVAEEVRVLVAGGLGGSARDLYPGLVAPLLERGLPAEHGKPLRAAPVLPPFAVVPFLAAAKSTLDAPSWLSGLVRSFETRRTSVREKLHERIEHLREAASAELLDAEPRLRAVIAAALRVPLGNALVQQHRVFEAALVAVEQELARDREAAAPLARISHQAGEDLERLSAELART